MRIVQIAIDRTTAERAAELLARIQAADPTVAPGYEHRAGFHYGLRVLGERPITGPHDLEPKPGDGVHAITVEIDDARAAQVDVLVERLGVPAEAILSAALCSGLGAMTSKTDEPFMVGLTPIGNPFGSPPGVRPIVGPFRVAEV